MKSVAIMGLGNFGTGLARNWIVAGHDVRGWTVEQEVFNSINALGVNEMKAIIVNGQNGDRVAGDGIWSIVKSLSAGRYEYKFVVDRNSWTQDPNAFDVIDDGYGGKNSVVIVK